MVDRASMEEIEWFRNYFKSANMDAFEMIDKAIDVAAHDHPDQLRFQKYRIAQRLFSGTLPSSTWNFVPPVEVSDENSVINPPVLKDASNSNYNHGGRFEARPRLIVRIKQTKRNYNEEQYREAQGESSVNSCVRDKADPPSKKRASRKDRKVAKSAKKRKLSCETEVLSGNDRQQFPASIRKITKIRFVHGSH